MDSQEREDLLDRIVCEYTDRCSREEYPPREEYYKKYPQLRSDLEPCFRMIEAGLAPAPTASSRLASGVVLGDFKILREIGRGGMGVVYLAEQEKLNRRVALKVLRHHLTLESRHVGRFQREARSAARLKHPNIVSIYGVGEDDGHQYIAMDYLPGPTLERVINDLRAIHKKTGERPTAADFAKIINHRDLAQCNSYPEAAIRFILPILDAVQAAHDAGIVHRDLKPSNILLDAAGSPSVADFGLAKGEGDIGLSFSGEPIGTPYYMAPEQVRAATKTVDGRTDLYSLGVTIYELLTLERPYQADSYPELVNKILSWPARSPRAVDKNISKNLERVILQSMHKTPEKRYNSAREFSQDLTRAISGGSVLARRSFMSGGMRAMPMPPGYVGWGYERKSNYTIFGIPLLHIAQGINPETGRPYIAKGIIAIGNTAVGVIAMGGQAVGIISFGGLSVGLLTAFGGLALSTGFAAGGICLGSVAIGGVSFGFYSIGGVAGGLHALSGSHRDPEAEGFFKDIIPWMMMNFKK